LVIGDHPNRPAKALQDRFPTAFAAAGRSKNRAPERIGEGLAGQLEWNRYKFSKTPSHELSQVLLSEPSAFAESGA
jgi:hypothetical protein